MTPGTKGMTARLPTAIRASSAEVGRCPLPIGIQDSHRLPRPSEASANQKTAHLPYAHCGHMPIGGDAPSWRRWRIGWREGQPLPPPWGLD